MPAYLPFAEALRPLLLLSREEAVLAALDEFSRFAGMDWSGAPFLVPRCLPLAYLGRYDEARRWP